MKVGVLGAMPHEVDIIREQMTDITTKTLGNRDYYCGKINHVDVVLVFSRCGKVAAAATVSALITEMKVTHIIFTGVAGAVSPELNIGDIVISKKLYQHDMDARPLFPRYEIPLMTMIDFHADVALIEKAQAACEKLLQCPTAVVSRNALKEFGIDNPKVMTGTITSGDQFMANSEQTQDMFKNRPDTLAVEMEGAAVAQVCVDYQIPFVVIRTISDRANHESPIDFPSFLERIAFHYAQAIIYHFFSFVKKEERNTQA